jgi:hypothetical protein
LVVDVVAPQDFEPAFARIEQSQPEALLVGVDPLIFNDRKAVIAFAARRRLPALYGTGVSDLVRDGGLMSYGTNALLGSPTSSGDAFKAGVPHHPNQDCRTIEAFHGPANYRPRRSLGH